MRDMALLSEGTATRFASSMPYPAYVVTTSGRVAFVNEAARCAAAPSSLLDTGAAAPGSVAELFAPPCRERAARAVAAALQARRVAFFQGVGESQDALYVVHPLSVDDGDIEALVVLVVPVNGSPRSQQALAESEERYGKLVELLPDAIMVHSDGVVAYLNAAGARLWGGTSSSEFIGMRHMDLIHPEDRAFVRERVQRIERGGESPLREYRIVRLDGGVVPIEAAGTLITYEGKPANLVMVRDITARKESQARLEETIRRYRSLFQDSPISLWEEDWTGFRGYLEELRLSGVTDLASYLDDHPDALRHSFSLLRLTDANRACVSFYGAHESAELMANMEKLFPDESRIIRDSLVAIADGETRVVSEGLTHTLAGEERHVVYHFAVSPGSEDTLESVVASVIDLTPQKRVENALMEVNARLQEEEAQRRLLSRRLMEMIENDRRGVAMELHDHFGQVLTTLKLDLEIIGASLGAADPALRRRAEEAAVKATQTIADLKNFASGLMPSMIENLGLVAALHALLESMRSSSNLEIQFFSSGIEERFDREKELALYRIAQESINNVLKHAHATKVFINLVKKDDVASLSVEDDGVGFTYDERHPLWHGGPLGLHIMRERMVQLGGELTINTRPGQGVHVLAEMPLWTRRSA